MPNKVRVKYVLWNEKRGHQLVFYVPTLQLISWPIFNQFSPNLISTYLHSICANLHACTILLA